eukprot:TRINITY_DN11472_c0_g1_i1.p1 TRINITY_DN11472_c0_g1~~TRINITY_DN11472_c0_g1_i1.p1  ORF type:complete len:121 (-),score=15.52 TRINITY_DN11472_c0_g1_i1:138-500(-)
MKHTYKIHGMTCNGCRSHVENTIKAVEGVTHATVDLEMAEAIIEMDGHIPLSTFKKALEDDGGAYGISMPGEEHEHHSPKKQKSSGSGTGTFYCPMHCEGDKTYDQPGIVRFVEWIWWKR